MSHEWEEVPIEDVQPGDVARCNGREFRVTVVQDHALTICAPGMERFIVRPFFVELGFMFWRKVKREPASGVGEVRCGDGELNWIGVPKCIPRGTKLRWAEILDGEDGS